MHSRLEHGSKYVSLPTLKSAFGVAGFVLTEEEVDFLIKRFADNRGHIEWRRLMVALDVAAPVDFTDPEQSFLDNLPQPYRLIVSVLETEIVDRAWALIVDRHPELDTSPTDEARAAADIDLKRSCPPSIQLQNPHPPLLLHGSRRVAKTIAAKDGNAAEQVEVRGGVEESPNGHGHEGNRESDDEAARDGDGEGSSSGRTLLRWDRCGEFLFSAGRDGSVCLRTVDALEEIAAQISSRCGRPTSLNPKKEMAEVGTGWEVIFLSEPVGALPGQRGRSTSVRVAAVTTPTQKKHWDAHMLDGTTKEDGEGEEMMFVSEATTPRSSTVVSVLEVAVLETSSSAGAGFGDATSHEHLDGSHGICGDRPTLKVVCDVELSSSEAAVSCALSWDGRRLAVCLADGRIVTWSLPGFSPLSKSSPQHKSGAGARAPTRHGDEGDEGASLGDSSTSLAGKDDEASTTKETVAAAGAEAAPTEPQLRLARPEFSIPHLPSPEELAYAKALQEYRRRVEAGDLQEPTSGAAKGGEVEEECTPPPRAPCFSGRAHHLARVDFLPIAPGLDGRSGNGGGLSVWRANSNVWRLYRLPPAPSEGEISKPQSSEGAFADADADGEDAGQPSGETAENMSPKLDISSLPSAEWILPSPITTLAVSEGDEGGGRGGGAEEGERHVHPADGGPEHDWGCSGRAASTAELAPLVAIGTASGGVFLCDAALGTTREALSRHRARVTTLAFHRKSGIVRVTCLREAPLVFAEDTSGRIVAYDLLTGSILGVLALGNSSTASATAAEPGTIGGLGIAARAETNVQRTGVVWSVGGDHLAAIIPEAKEESSAVSSVLPASNETLCVWSGSDVMWGLSPGLRAIAGEERPRDVAALFFGLLPAQRKNAEGKMGIEVQPLLPPPSRPAACRSRTNRSDNNNSRRAATSPPRIGTADTDHRSHRSAAAAGRASPRNNNGIYATALAEGNVAKHLGGAAGGNAFGGVFAEGSIGGGGGVDCVPWRSEDGLAFPVILIQEPFA
eukprot:g11654.t1